MKPLRKKRPLTRGNILFVTLSLTAIIAIVIASYLTLVSQQNGLTKRSESFNFAVGVVEAGIEEAMAHLNQDGMTNLLIPQSTLNLYSDGWQSENGLAVMRRSVGNSRYIVSISVTGATPVVECLGYVPAPSTIAAGGNVMLAAAGVNLPATEVRRAVRVTTQINPIFQYALVVKKNINSNGNSTKADAFDSANPLYSTAGKYDAAKAQDGGGIATLSGLANQLSFGSANIYGHVATGPGGSINAASWAIGSHAWQGAHPTGIQSGYFSTDFNASLPNPKAPYASGITPTGGTLLNGITYDYILTDGNSYYINSGSLKGKVLVIGNATLYVTKDATVSFSATTDSITLTNNGSLKLYVGSPSATLPNLVNNSTADKFTYFGLSTNTKVVQNVNADFTGTAYAPNADWTLGGSGLGVEQKITGSIVANSINFNDFFTFHYDQRLGRVGLARGYVVNSWNEINPGTAKAQ